jgi:hypothetical protein
MQHASASHQLTVSRRPALSVVQTLSKTSCGFWWTFPGLLAKAVMTGVSQQLFEEPVDVAKVLGNLSSDTGLGERLIHFRPFPLNFLYCTRTNGSCL